jgi:titin
VAAPLAGAGPAWAAVPPAPAPGRLVIPLSGTPSASATDSTHRITWVAQSGAGTVAVIDDTTGFVLAEVPVGTGPDGVAVDPVTDTVYVSNGGSGTVSVINGATDKVTATVNVGTSPGGIAVDVTTDTIFVANSGNGTVSVISGATHAVTATPTVGTTPTGVAVNAATAQVYVTNAGSGNVSFLSATSDTVTKTVSVGSGPGGVAVNSGTNDVYVANKTDGTLSVVYGTTGVVTGSDKVGSAPVAVGFDETTGDVLVVNSGDGTMSVLAGTGPAVTSTLGVDTSPTAVSIDSASDAAYVASSGALTVIGLAATLRSTVKFPGAVGPIDVDSATGNVLALEKATAQLVLLSGPGLATQTKIPDAQGPVDVASDPATGLAYVGNYKDSTVWVVNEASPGSAPTSITVTPAVHPTAVAVNSLTDTIYVADGSGNLSVIDGASGTVVQTVVTGRAPVDVTVDPATGAVFVASSSAVWKFTGSPLAESGKVTLPATPSGITFDATDGLVDVVTPLVEGVTEVNPSTMATTVESVPAVLAASTVVAADVSGLTYVAGASSGALWAVREGTSTLAATEPVADPTGLGVDTTNGAVYAASPGGVKTSTLTILGGPVAPAPVVLTAKPGNHQVMLSWAALTGAETGGSPITGYAAAEFAAGATTATAEVTLAQGATSTTFTNLVNGTQLYFEVAAVNAIGPGSPAVTLTEVPATLPDAPKGVTAVAGNQQASVSWTAPVADGGDPVTSYVVTPFVGGSPKANLAATVSGTPPATATIITGLTNGTTYTFEVAAVTLAGQGPYSAASKGVIPATLPSASGAISAIGGNASAQVSWAAPANGGLPISAYLIVPYEGGSAVTGLEVDVRGSPPPTQTTVTGLTNGAFYNFTVTASNALGAGPESRHSVTVSPGTVPAAPAGVTAVAGNATADVSWSAPAVDGGRAITSYIVTPFVGSTPQSGLAVTVTGSGTSPPATQATVTGLTNGTVYTFEIAAGNALGSGPESLPSAGVTPATIPSAPTGVRAAPGTAQATVNWKAPDNGGLPITSYRVTPLLAAAPQHALTVTVTAHGGSVPTTAVVTDLVDGTSYTFEVSAANSLGSGPAVGASTAVVPSAPPSPPLDVQVTEGAGRATVRWSKSVSDGGLALVSYVVTPIVNGSPDSHLDVTVPARATTLQAVFRGLVNGTSYSFSVVARTSAHSSAPGYSGAVVPVGGFWLVTPAGRVVGIGTRSLGSVQHLAGGDRVAAIVALHQGIGYDVVTAHGQVSCYGAAHCYGTVSRPASPVVALLLTADQKGYLIVEANGTVHPYGDAKSQGSLAHGASATAIAGATMTPDGKGYLIVNSAGKVFAFGDAHSHGSLTKADGTAPARGIVMTPDGKGYYITQATGAIRRYGTIGYFGSFTSLGYQLDPAGLAIFPGSNGYIEVARDGVAFSLGPGGASYAPPTGQNLTATAGIALAA